MLYSPQRTGISEAPSTPAALLLLVFLLMVAAISQYGCIRGLQPGDAATAPIPPSRPSDGEWTPVRVAQESHDIYWQLRANPSLADNPPSAWFGGHPDRGRLVQESIRLWTERAGE